MTMRTMLLAAVLYCMPFVAQAQITVCTPDGWADHKCKSFESNAQAEVWSAKNSAAIAKEAAALGSQINDIVLAIMKSQYGNSKSYGSVNPMTTYLTVLGNDPPPSLIKGLAKAGITVLPGNRVEPDKDAVVGDKMMISFYRFKPTTGGKVRVGWRTYCGSLCASGFIAVVKSNGQAEWVVISDQMQWISQYRIAPAGATVRQGLLLSLDFHSREETGFALARKSVL